jgi:uncharacterized protein
MRVIITGGTGLIGRALAASLARDGNEVIVLSRHAGETGLPKGVRAEQWDARTAKGWGPLADGAEAIVNLAGESLSAGRWSSERKRRILESRLDAGRAVVEAVEHASNKPKVLIQSSAIGYYGSRGSQEITEEAGPGKGFLSQVCLKWEASTAAVEEQGVRRAVIRSAPVFSSRGGVLPNLVTPFRFLVGGQLGTGRQWFSWIHIVDEIRAIRFLIESEAARGDFNLSSPRSVTNRQLSLILGRVLHRPSLVPLPSFALQLALGEMSAVLLDSQRVKPKRLLELGFTYEYPDLATALRSLLQ